MKRAKSKVFKPPGTLYVVCEMEAGFPDGVLIAHESIDAIDDNAEVFIYERKSTTRKIVTHALAAAPAKGRKS